MGLETHTLTFNGRLLQRGFWLYVWEITLPTGETLYYVGRTGDSSSMNAQSPFNRMSQHLGFNRNSNLLRRRLKDRGIDAENCTFRLVAHGPIVPEADSEGEHRQRRDCVAAMERALAEALAEAGYEVLEPAPCRSKLELQLFASVRTAFAVEFPKLGKRRDA